MLEGRCPSCGKSIPVDPQGTTGLCPYCRTQYLTADALAVTTHDPIADLESRVRRLAAAGMPREAERVANDARRLRPDDFRSWVMTIRATTDDLRSHTPVEEAYIDKAVRLLAATGGSAPDFEQWLHAQRAIEAKVRRCGDLCNRLPAETAFRTAGRDGVRNLGEGAGPWLQPDWRMVARNRWGVALSQTRFYSRSTGLHMEATYTSRDSRFTSDVPFHEYAIFDMRVLDFDDLERRLTNLI